MGAVKTLEPAQWEGAQWLAGMTRALLADGPRVGKTPQSIVACDLVDAGSVLVVCPGIARDHWAREFGAWSLFGRPVAVVMDASDPIEPHGVTILSMDGSRNEGLHARAMAHRWDVLIIDEAQYLKEPGSQRTQMVCSAEGFAARADRIWFLTGSPVLNHPAELWVMLVTIGVYLGSYVDFLNRYCDWFMGDYGPVVKAVKNAEALRALLAPVMLRRTFYELHPDAPRPMWEQHALDPSHTDPEDWKAFLEVEGDDQIGGRAKALVRRLMAGEDVDTAAAGRKEGMTRLRWATSFAKVKPVAAWARDRLVSGESDKLVIFAHHSGIVRLLTEQLAEFGAMSIAGSTKMKARQRIIDSFREDPRERVRVVQDQIGRTAIDLSAARDLAFAEMDWVPENNAQASMRIQGLNQKRPPRLHNLFLPGSTDEGLSRVIEKKSRMVAEILS